MSSASDGGTILETSTTTSTQADGSQTVIEVTRFRNANGSITEETVTHRIPAPGGPRPGLDESSGGASAAASGGASAGTSNGNPDLASGAASWTPSESLASAAATAGIGVVSSSITSSDFFPRSSYNYEPLAPVLDSPQEVVAPDDEYYSGDGEDSISTISNTVIMPTSTPEPTTMHVNVPVVDMPSTAPVMEAAIVPLTEAAIVPLTETAIAPVMDPTIVFNGPPSSQAQELSAGSRVLNSSLGWPSHTTSGGQQVGQQVGQHAGQQVGQNYLLQDSYQVDHLPIHQPNHQIASQIFQQPAQPQMAAQGQVGMHQGTGQVSGHNTQAFGHQTTQWPVVQQPVQDHARMQQVVGQQVVGQQTVGQHPTQQQTWFQPESLSETPPRRTNTTTFWTRKAKMGACALLVVILAVICISLGIVLSQSNDDSNPDNVVSQVDSPNLPIVPSSSSSTPLPTTSSLTISPTKSNSKIEDCVPFVLDLRTDRYANETYWIVRNQQSMFMEGGPYPYGETTIVDSVCLPIGSYEFLIYDMGDDGICCNYGMGKYGIRIGDSELRPLSNGEFAAEERISFEVTAKDMSHSAFFLSDNPSYTPSSIPSISSMSPSASPSSSPSVIPSSLPSVFPTMLPSESLASVMPTSCSNIEITIWTDSQTGGDDGDIVVWELIQRNSGNIVRRGGPLAGDRLYAHDLCLPDGRYLFHISDSGGDGFGTDLDKGFFVKTGGLLIGGSVEFFHDAYFDFALPYDGDEYDGNELDFCGDDFYFGIILNGSPEDIHWEVVDDETGEVVMEGGPYDEKFVTLTYQACLPNGEYTFTIDVGDRGLVSPYFYVLFINDEVVVNADDGRDFGNTDVVPFVLESPPKPTTTPTSIPSSAPSHLPTKAPIIPPEVSTLSPTESFANCVDLTVAVATDLYTGGNEGDIVTWEVIRDDNSNIVLSGGPLGSNKTYINEDCLRPGVYTFIITDSGGDGFRDDCELCGYFLFSGDIYVGGSVTLTSEDKMSFFLPYTPDLGEDDFCTRDFVVYVRTDSWPDETSWQLEDAAGQVVLRGGPYKEKWETYSHRACLTDGTYKFTISDSGNDGFASPGYYWLSSGGNTLVDGSLDSGEFGASNTTVFAVGIQVTMQPSSGPTKSFIAGSLCYDVRILVETDARTGAGVKGDVTTWQLIQEATGDITASGGPLGSNKTYINDNCLPEGIYTFNITDSGGDGFGDDCDTCGYFIYSEGLLVGGSVLFFDNELLTFQVPFYGDEPDGDEYDWCSNDFFVAIATDNWPDETRWELINSDGEIQLKGGPYQIPRGTYSQRACLPDGTFTFTIYDSEEDGIAFPGLYFLMIESNVLVSSGESARFGASNTTVFTLGPPVTAGPVATPAIASTMAPTLVPSLAPLSASIFPTQSNSPSINASSCTNITIEVETDGTVAKAIWELIQKRTGNVVLVGGPIGIFSSYRKELCLPQGTYEFSFTDSRGNGFGDDCEGCGYYIYSDDILVGHSAPSYHNEIMTFSIPFYDKIGSCSGDFSALVYTDDMPSETRWEVVDADGTMMLGGGPYQNALAGYSQKACLPGGEFNFTIYDSSGNGIAEPGFYSLSADEKLLAQGNAFGISNTTVFSLRSLPTSPPTKAPNGNQPCIDVVINIQTDAGTGGVDGDVTTWELIQKETGNIVADGGPLGTSESFFALECLDAGAYTFNITDSGGDGFGDICDGCGYFIYANGIFVGGSVVFFDNEQLTFQIPFYEDEPDGDEFNYCTSDFYFAVYTDWKPYETTWELVDATGDVLLSGGPYSERYAIYTQRACLPDGTFYFTIYDSGGDGLSLPSTYYLFAEDQDLVTGDDSSGDFGASNTTTFILGLNAIETSQPTTSPTPQPFITTPTAGSGPCSIVRIIIQTDVNTGGNSGDLMNWELIQESTKNVVLSGGPLESDRLHSEQKCLPEGVYTFNITDSGGDGFEEDCESCGYLILSDNSLVGGGGFIFYQETLTFSIPYYGGIIGSDDVDICSDDFMLLIFTDFKPDETTWDLTDKDGNVVLSGGPYYSSFSFFVHNACLPLGNFNFTIYDSGGDGISSPGTYFLFVNGDFYVSGDEDSGNFGDYNTTTVTVGTLI